MKKILFVCIDFAKANFVASAANSHFDVLGWGGW